MCPPRPRHAPHGIVPPHVLRHLAEHGGDAARARAVSTLMITERLRGERHAVAWCLTRPAHVNVNVLELMPVQQAFAPFAVHRHEP
jgi:NADP-dependent 3-hydroxy acid dehydrogenase YdfG